MFKYLVAAAVALAPMQVSAQPITIAVSSDRLTTIQKLAESVCRQTALANGDVEKEYNRIVEPLLLTPDENLIMLSLCVLYGQGRIDSLKVR